MSILNLRKISYGFGGHPLLENADLVMKASDKLCLLGRNGMGKSTLLKIIAGEIEADAGVVEKDSGLKISCLQQTFPSDLAQTIFDVVAAADDGLYEHQINKILSKLNLNPHVHFDELSGGLKRRTLLAKALVTEPDLLLLDEPTNHLDIESIQWLEDLLTQYRGAIILVTHDRQLMQTMGNYFAEIDHGKLITWRGDYQGFLKHKDYFVSAEAEAEKRFNKKLAQEEVWIRQGIKARRTRNEGRVRSLKKMREAFQQRRTKLGDVKIAEQMAHLSGKEVFLVDKINFAYEKQTIIENFSCIIQRGDKIGLLGPNGVGKSTLINLLLKKIEPNEGIIKHGTKLEIAYYDQHRTELEEEKSIFDNVCEGSDFVEIENKKVHLLSYLQDFLFTPERIRTPVKALSGGERNRVMLAKLFIKPSNLLILDEPTNDLDIETLELLEDKLSQYPGTLLLVSHDRQFINNIVSSTLVFEDNGKIQQYAGGYDDWLIQRKNKKPVANPKTTKKKSKTTNEPGLTYEEKKQLKQLPKKIEKVEEQLQAVQDLLADPKLYQKSPEEIAKVTDQDDVLQKQLQELYDQWEFLEQKN